MSEAKIDTAGLDKRWRYRENGTDRGTNRSTDHWGDRTGTDRFRLRAARKKCRGAQRCSTRKTGEEERRQENQGLDSPGKYQAVRLKKLFQETTGTG